MNFKFLKDIIGWDVVNWGHSLQLFEKNINFSSMKSALEIGCGSFGGYSLYLASKNIKTICSNPFGDFDKTKAIHSKYSFKNNLKYEKIDALNIKYDNKFDCIAFKSVIGVLGYGKKDRYDNIDREKQMISQIHNALKPNGYLIMTENLKASVIHQYINNKYGWGKNSKGWRYFSVKEYFEIIGDKFELIDYETRGVLGYLGKYEPLKNILGTFDSLILDNFVSEDSKYILSCVFKKK